MPSASDQTLENQNEEELNSLHNKIRSLRSVTIDILDDANRQNDQLDRTTNTFSSFASSLFSTSRHHSRSIAANSTLRQYRTIAYIVVGVVVFWLVMKVWRMAPSVGGGAGEGGDGEI